MQNEIHRLDVGTVFEVTLMDGSSVVNISTATTKEIYFQLPNGTKLTKSASFTTDGTDGKLRYTTVADDLSLAGGWRIQAHIITPAGQWRSDLGKFKVYENL